MPPACGAFCKHLTYSDGSNDDVNKFIWTALGWNPDGNVTELLRDYGRCFIGSRQASDFARGLLALERNWERPLVANAAVETTLQQFQTMEQSVSPQTLQNWRFQQALYRAYYDAYLRHSREMTQACSPKVTHHLPQTPVADAGFPD